MKKIFKKTLTKGIASLMIGAIAINGSSLIANAYSKSFIFSWNSKSAEANTCCSQERHQLKTVINTTPYQGYSFTSFNLKSINAKKADVCSDTKYRKQTENHKNTYGKAVWEKYKKGEYPVDCTSSQWEEMSYSDAVNACEMPTEMFKEMSTEDLASYVLNYPFLIEMYIYDSYEEGLEHLKNISSVCAEFCGREDALSVLVDQYSTLDSDYASVSEGSDLISQNGYLQEMFMESYLGNNIENMSKDEKEKVKESLEEKFEEKNETVRNFSSATGFYEAVYEVTGKIDEEIIPENIEEYYKEDRFATLAGFEYGNSLVSWSGTTYNEGIYEKYGKRANCWKYCYGDYTSQEKTNLNDEFQSKHPSFTFVSNATKKYNCHSYAWISQNTTKNEYWLNSPEKFASSTGYFSKVGTNCSAVQNDKVILDILPASNPAQHSVIMTSTSRCKSKFGAMGVYKCKLSEAMKVYSANSYRVYRAK